MNLPVSILSLVCLVVYGFAVPRLFRPSGSSRGLFTRLKLTITLLFMGLPLWVLAHTMFYRAEVWCQIAAVVMGFASLTLFFWSYRQHGTQVPGRVFSPDVPARIITSGPYARVRHPIYSAYLLFMLGLVVGAQSAEAAVLWLLLAVTYRRAARQEDELLSGSAHADFYRRYMQQSGRLLPWNVWRKRVV
nr:isoprenylcysteine carboxylmethyltransferase family protein [Prosthecobacter vanneervenii]